MSRRLVKRNANACFALALGAAPFLLMFLLLAWPLGLIVLGNYFEHTETPREVW